MYALKKKISLLLFVLISIGVAITAFSIAYAKAEGIKVVIKSAEEDISRGEINSAKELLQSSYQANNNKNIKDLLQAINAGNIPPISDLKSGSYNDYKEVALKCLASKGDIYYTLDGSKPNLASNKYKEAIMLPEGKTTLRAVTLIDNKNITEETIYNYTINISKKAVKFKDKGFEKAIREELKKAEGDIYNTDLSSIKEINIVGNTTNSELQWWRNDGELIYKDSTTGAESSEKGSIISLEDIEMFRNLEKVTIVSNNISDISPLKKLSKLSYINLNNNNISDITTISKLDNLRYLSLSGNPIKGFAPLTALKQLEKLELNYVKVGNIDFLSENTSLLYLQLNKTGITSLDPLNKLINLKLLWADQNSITDINSISNMKSIEYLDISYNKISDITPLRGLTSLKQLWIMENNISDYSPLESLKMTKVSK